MLGEEDHVMRAIGFVLLGMLSACAPEKSGELLPAQKKPATDAALAADLADPVDAYWPVPSDLGPTSCDPCPVKMPGISCGVSVDITPFTKSTGFGEFQSAPGSGASSPITINLSSPVRWVEIKIFDPDFVGNMMRVYDGSGALVGSIDFPSDGTPNALTAEFRGLAGQQIQKIELIPAPADYVTYGDFTIIPTGCSPPVL